MSVKIMDEHGEAPASVRVDVGESGKTVRLQVEWVDALKSDSKWILSAVLSPMKARTLAAVLQNYATSIDAEAT
jgi:hypothetical protein